MKSTVSEKGQVTIPKPLRNQLGIRAGQVLEFESRNGVLIARKEARAPDAVDRVTGILPPMDVDKEIASMRGPAWSPKDAGHHAKRR